MREGPGVLVSSLAYPSGVGFVEIGVVDVHAVWRYADDGPVLHVQVADSENIGP